MKKLTTAVLLFLCCTTLFGQEEPCQIRYYLFTNGTAAATAWAASDDVFELQDDGAGPYLTYWTPADTNIPPPDLGDLPDAPTACRWVAANRPTLALEAEFTNQLALIGRTNLTESPLVPGEFQVLFSAVKSAIDAETNLTAKVALHTSTILLDALYQELREHIDTGIYSPYLGTTNDLSVGPI